MRHENFVIVDGHQEVLSSFLQKINLQIFSPVSSALLHFDSHPDLAVPSQKNKKLTKFLLNPDTNDAQTLLKFCDISSWITPLLFCGYLQDVIWFSPWWFANFCSLISKKKKQRFVNVVK